MVQTPHDTAVGTAEYNTGRTGLDRVQLIAATIGALFLAGILVWIWRANQPHPTQPRPPVAASTTAPAAPAPVSQSALAYAAAEKTYRAWSANYANAVTTFDESKLNPALVTPQVLTQVKDQFARLATPKDGGTAKYTQNIKTIRGAKYEPNAVTITVCAFTDARFIDKNGKDVSITPEGKPAPVATEPLANDATATSADGGKTWVISKLTTELDATAGISC